MAVVLMDTKYTFRYNSTRTGEDAILRSIGGLNVSGGSGSPNSGPDRNTALTNLVTTLQSFSAGAMSNVRWVSEQEVQI